MDGCLCFGGGLAFPCLLGKNKNSIVDEALLRRGGGEEMKGVGVRESRVYGRYGTASTVLVTLASHPPPILNRFSFSNFYFFSSRAGERREGSRRE